MALTDEQVKSVFCNHAEKPTQWSQLMGRKIYTGPMQLSESAFIGAARDIERLTSEAKDAERKQEIKFEWKKSDDDIETCYVNGVAIGSVVQSLYDMLYSAYDLVRQSTIETNIKELSNAKTAVESAFTEWHLSIGGFADAVRQERERCEAIYDFMVNKGPLSHVGLIDGDIQDYIRNQRLGMEMLMEKLFPEGKDGHNG